MRNAEGGDGVTELLVTTDQILDASLISKWSLRFDSHRNSNIEYDYRTYYHNKYVGHGMYAH
jgi:hypothetical protein